MPAIWKLSEHAEVALPDGWVLDDEDDDAITIYRSDGAGALQISFARRASPSPMIDLDSLNEAFVAKNALQDVARSVGTLGLARSAYVDGISADQTFWRMWHAVHGELLARVTYNCEAQDRERERDAIDGIIASWVWLTGQS